MANLAFCLECFWPASTTAPRFISVDVSACFTQRNGRSGCCALSSPKSYAAATPRRGLDQIRCRPHDARDQVVAALIELARVATLRGVTAGWAGAPKFEQDFVTGFNWPSRNQLERQLAEAQAAEPAPDAESKGKKVYKSIC